MDTYAIAEALCDATQTSQVLAQQLLHLTQLQKTLEGELMLLRGHLQELKSPAFQPPLSLQRQTLEWARNTKQLRTKLAEYTDRLASLQANPQGSGLGGVSGLISKEEQISQLEDRITLMSAKVAAYKGLPKDKEAAIDEVLKVEAEVLRLQRRLDSLFEKLVERR